MSRRQQLSGPVRLLRGAMLAVSSTTLAITAHGVAGGGWPETLPVLPLSLLIALAGTALADRWRSGWTIIGALGMAELAQHVLLSVMHGDAVLGSGLMTCAHLVALLLTAVLLAKADAAIVAVAGAVRRLLPRVPSFPHPDRALVAPVVFRPADHVLDVLFRRSLGRRGPPVLS
ncbi:hypothetical protein [Kutzneria sp. CA-103260]|uniref:hypothetical protein n=1 Tax=Kutzneria sp. CA-103260 TaxID=2802641 RepID=UPI00201168E2|nr:hypothetical protein [Kutzneria sp. CA-103260]